MRQNQTATMASSSAYLQKRYGKPASDRQKVKSILGYIDGAIEDGATDGAKQKASAERAASSAPIPAFMKNTMPLKKETESKEKTPASEARMKAQSPRRHRSKSRDKRLVQMKKPKESVVDSEKESNSIRSVRSIRTVVHDSPRSGKASVTQTPKSRGKSPRVGKKPERRKSTGKTLPVAPPLSRDEQRKKEKKEKKEKKKEKKEKKKKKKS